MELGRHRAPGPPDPRRARPPRTTSGRCPRSSAAGRPPAAAPSCWWTAVLERSGAARAGADARGAAALAVGRGSRARTFRLPRQRAERTRVRVSMRGAGARAVEAGGPEAVLGRASCCATAARSSRSTAAASGLRSVTVKRGMLYLNNRRIKLRRRLDPRGHARQRRGAHSGRHGPHRRRPQGGRRERHALALPAQRGPAGAPRPRRDHGLEPGADLAARPQGERAARAAAAPARLGDGAAHRDRGAQPPLGDHPLGGQRALVAPRRPPARDPPLPGARAGDRARLRPDAADLGRHQRPPPPPRAVHLPQVRHARDQPVLRLVPVGRELRRPAALPAGDARPVSRAGAGDDGVRRRGAPGARQRPGRP